MTNDPRDSDFERIPNRPDLDADRGSGWGVAIAIALVLAFAVFLMARAWRSDDINLSRTDTPRAISPRQPSIDLAIPAAGVQGPELNLTTLSQNSTEHYGKTVSVQGVVRKMVNSSAFTIAAPEGGAETLVVVAQLTQPQPAPGQKVRVNGTYKAFDQGQVQQALGDRFREEPFADHTDKPMIFAISVQPIGDVGQ